jgi:uncharacterized RDD family membrane protein YckC
VPPQQRRPSSWLRRSGTRLPSPPLAPATRPAAAPAAAANPAWPQVALFTAGLPTPEEWPTWYYQDLAGALQGPFEVGAMIKWYQDGALPGDLLVCGVSPLDKPARPQGFAAFRPLQALLADAAAGRGYTRRCG